MDLLSAQKSQKEVVMKKLLVFALALFLAVPALSFAGSATSKWDVTIGGFVKFDMGYASQAQGADYGVAKLNSDEAAVFEDEFENLYMAAGESRFNFLINGPDAWGAKTSAFIEGDFRGSSGGLGDTYGGFGLRHAFMKMKWANDSLTIGQTWNTWANMPSFSGYLLSYNGLAPFMKASRQPQITWVHDFNKNWGFSLGVLSPNNVNGTLGNTRVDSYSISGYPFGEAEVRWTSDACGKIGPFQMLFGLGGFFGQEKKYSVSGTATDPDFGTYATGYNDDMQDAWGAAFKAFIPIIPEKKGNKAGALALSGAVFAAQNGSWFFYPPAAIYADDYRADNDFASARKQGAWGQLSYWFTNDLSIHGWYGYMKNKLSNRQAYDYLSVRNGQVSAYVDTVQQMMLNVSYDVNPAMRLGIQGDYITTKYAMPSNDLVDRNSDMWSVRIGAWYFF